MLAQSPLDNSVERLRVSSCLAEHREIQFCQVERSMTSSLYAHRLQYVGVSLRQILHVDVMLRFENH